MLFDVEHKALFHSSAASAEKIVIPDGTRAILGAFCGFYKLREVYIPDGVEEIGDSSFCGCERLSVIRFPRSLREIGWAAFKGCKSLRFITIPGDSLNVSENAFAGCDNMVKAIIPYKTIFTGINSSACCGLINIAYNAEQIPQDVPRFVREFSDREEAAYYWGDRKADSIMAAQDEEEREYYARLARSGVQARAQKPKRDAAPEETPTFGKRFLRLFKK